MEFFQEQYFKVELQINIEIYKSINNWLLDKFSRKKCKNKRWRSKDKRNKKKKIKSGRKKREKGKRRKTTLLHDWYRNKEDCNHIEAAQLLIFFFFFFPTEMRKNSCSLSIYFNINKRIPKEKSALVILDFSNPLAARRRDASKEVEEGTTRLPSNSHWQSCVLVFCFTGEYVILFIEGVGLATLHYERRCNARRRVSAHKSEQCTGNKARADLLSLWFSAENWILVDNASR